MSFLIISTKNYVAFATNGYWLSTFLTTFDSLRSPKRYTALLSPFFTNFTWPSGSALKYFSIQTSPETVLVHSKSKVPLPKFSPIKTNRVSSEEDATKAMFVVINNLGFKKFVKTF